MSDQRDSSRERPALNARSSSKGQHASQPNLPSHSSMSALGKGSTHPQVEALFDRVLNDKGKSKDKSKEHDSNREKLSPDNPSIIINPPTPKTSTSNSQPQEAPVNRGSSFDEELFKKFLFFTKMTQAIQPPTPPAKPTIRELSLVLHKWLPNVPKLHTNGDNFQTWVVMVQQALEGTLGYSIVLMEENLTLEPIKDNLLKTAILATINDNIKVGVAESPSGLEGFRLIADTFTLKSRTSHIALMKQVLDLKFNHLDRNADLDAHFRQIENLVKNLFRSGFVLSEESFTGLLFHLSLPNLESFPFVNVARQLDLRMEQGNTYVKNVDLLRLAKNELTLFRNNRRAPSDHKSDKPSGSREWSSSSTSQGSSSKWCHKCKNNSHHTRDCTKPPAAGSSLSGNSFPRSSNPGNNNPFRSVTAPPKSSFQANLSELPSTSEDQQSTDVPTLQSITLDEANPSVTPEELSALLERGGRLFGLDSWENED